MLSSVKIIGEFFDLLKKKWHSASPISSSLGLTSFQVKGSSESKYQQSRCKQQAFVQSDYNFHHLELQIVRDNYLYRLTYGGEKKRRQCT